MRRGRGGAAGDTEGSGRGKRAEPIARVLADYLKSSGLAPRMALAGVMQEWPKLVGKKIAAETIPVRVTADGTLFVAVTTHAWMQELSLLEPQLLTAINVVPGRPAVRKIRWQVKR